MVAAGEVLIVRRQLACLLACALITGAAHARLHAFAYHDVRDNVADASDPDRYAISTANLIAHFSWLRANGFTPVSIDDVIDARAGRRALPEKAVLLTFDDGLVSTYTHVFPLLKLFGYPAVVSIVTDWIGNPEPVDYGGRPLDQSGFLTWEQLREMQASGLVEVASHSNDLHRGIEANPQRNLQPAAITRSYTTRGYESDAAYAARIAADLALSVERIRAELGAPPRVLAWPYGAYDHAALEIAEREGFEVMLGLDVAFNPAIELREIQREVITNNPGLQSFAPSLLYPPTAPIVRTAQVDLDYVFDTDPEQQERNLGRLIDRIHALEISHVYLQAFADPDADGGAAAVYFPSEHLPMRADLFNRAAWQLKTRAQVQVYAWLPLLSFVGPGFDPAWRVLEQQEDGSRLPDPDSEPRLSPFHPQARERIAAVYGELAAHADFDGILFHDDGRLNENEDASDAALAAYRDAFGEDFTIERARQDPALAAQWARFKSRALIDLSRELAAAARRYQPDLKTARNLFSTALLDPRGEQYLAQSFGDYLEAYDYTALMAMPRFEGAEDHEAFYSALVDAVARDPRGLERTLFELQTVDWRSGEPIPALELRDTMRWLLSRGVKHLGYYPDDFILGDPELDVLRQGISLAEYPRVMP